MMPYKYTLDQTKLLSGVTIEVRFIRTREMRIRLWIAVKLFLLAGLITGMGIEIVEQEVEDVNAS